MEIRVEQEAAAFWPVVEEIAFLWNPVSFCGGVFSLEILAYEDTGAGFAAIAGGEGNAVTIEEPYHLDEAKEHQGRRLLRLALYRLLSQRLGGGSPWGILTGVRPLKVLRRLLEAGMSLERIRQVLLERYALTPEKVNLLLACLPQQQRYWRGAPFFGKAGIYVGIPFCPSRCSYCSFAGVDIHRHPDWVKPYLLGLEQEICQAGEALHQVGWQVDSLYVGGGTPTSITPEQLAHLLAVLRQELPLSADVEFTVEAGRPDTLNDWVWQVMKDDGVNRVSVNPQTKHQETLLRIGRSHRAEEVVTQVAKGHEMGFCINMDLIAGLPGENPEDFTRSLDWAIALQPENLTVHTLSVKRGSVLKQQGGAVIRGSMVPAMLRCRDEMLKEKGYEPYYLYRQKNTLDLMENVGYCMGDTASRYNMAVMDEQQVILGLGAGAGSKWVKPDGTLTASYNPKDILCYLKRSRLGELNKIDKLSQLIYNSWK